MLTVFFQKIINTGITSSMPNFLQKKIIITNFIALVFLILCIPFLIFTFNLFPQLLLLPVIFIVNCLLILVINSLGYFHFSRFQSCIINISVYTIYNCYLLPDNQPLIASLYACQIIFWMVPWLLFDLNERFSLIVYVIFSLAISLGLPYLNNLFTQQYNIESFQNGFLGNLLFGIAAIGITGPLFFFMFSNYFSEKTSIQLVDKLEEQKNELVKKEEELKKYVGEIEEGLETDKERAWFSEGLAKFAEIMRVQNSSTKELAMPILSNLVKYIGANQGSMFVLNNLAQSDPYLELMSCYAYDRKKFLIKRIDIGQGLVGQCFLEKNTVYLKRVPQNYVRITSGLGELPPTVLLIVPIVLNNEVYGVIELADFKEIPEYKIKFVEKLGESIAGTLSTVKTNESIRKLLDESHQLTSEMKQREEEMRQNLEEFSAIQEEMIRKEREYQKRINELTPQH
jgi:hypothetical protein